MSQKPINRRKFLTATASVIGGIGMATAVVPFLSSWKPSKKAVAAGAPITVDIGKMELGQMLTVEWRGRPIWIVRRNQQQLDSLKQVTHLISDPSSSDSDQPEVAKNEHRSIKPEFLILVGVCTHLGCSPLYRPSTNDSQLGDEWQGGFFCPCHGSKFDLAGRVFKGAPAPTNLPVPPHIFLDDSQLLIGKNNIA